MPLNTVMPINVFSIPQVVNLVLPESTGTTETSVLMNYPMNRTDFKLIRSVQNQILFFARDIDRHAVTFVPGTVLTLNIVDPIANLLLLTVPLTIQDPTRALYNATLSASVTADWNIGPLRYSVTVTNPDGSINMLWTDRDYSPYGFLLVDDGPQLLATPAMVLTPAAFTPDGMLFGGTVPDPTIVFSAALPGAAQLGYPNGMHTIAAYTTLFTGVITIQGSLQALPTTDSDWFIALSQAFLATSGVTSLNVQGNFLWTRIVVSGVISGTVDQILYKN